MKKQIITSNLILRTPRIEDLSSLKVFENRNKNHLAKWETINDFSSEEEDHKRLMSWLKECEEEKSTRFFIFTKENPDQIIGIGNLTQIVRGVFQACYLGYKIDHRYEGKGFMFEALQETICYAFEELQLHRIMANYMPINIRSAKLLNRLGFVIEGFARNYLFINNRWEDHVLTALSKEEWIGHQSQF
jgi:ribosomal-protein-alanine N-acetyltransferase